MNFLLYMDAYWIFLMIVIIIRVIASSHFLSQKDMKKWREMVFQGQKIKATGKLKKLIGHQLFFKQQVNFGCWHHQLPSIN